MRADERAAAAALLRSAPTTRDLLADHGVPDELVRATLADLGQQAVVHRARHGRPGLRTWWWSALVAAGGLVQVGRLQLRLQLHRQPVALAAGRSPGCSTRRCASTCPARTSRPSAPAPPLTARSAPDGPLRP